MWKGRVHMNKMTHFNADGRAKMIDISYKPVTRRVAIARSSMKVSETVYKAIRDNAIQKGDVLHVAQIAGIMAAKSTASIIPMCHPISITGIDISFSWSLKNDEFILFIEAEVATTGKTGVEMEALTAASVTALTIYDMCKTIDPSITIGETYLYKRTGGKNGEYIRKW